MYDSHNILPREHDLPSSLDLHEPLTSRNEMNIIINLANVISFHFVSYFTEVYENEIISTWLGQP